MPIDNVLEDARKRMEVKGTVGAFKQQMKNKKGMVKSINAGSSLASGLQKQSNFQFGKQGPKKMAKGKY